MDPDQFTSDWADQLASERMKTWMQNHNWSVSLSADPADIYEFIQEHGDDADFHDLSSNL